MSMTDVIRAGIEQDLKDGKEVVIIDPQGGEDIKVDLEWIAEMGKGRNNDVIFFEPTFPEKSNTFNPDPAPAEDRS